MQALHLDPELTGQMLAHETVHVSLEPLSTEEISRIWALFPTANYRTSIAYLATPVWQRPAAAVTSGRAGGGGFALRRNQGHGGPAMSRPFDIYEPPELAYHRRVLFAIEVLDAVTLERVTQGLKVKALGLKGLPIVNAGGLFVWLSEDLNALQNVTIEPGVLPFESVEIPAAQLKIPLSIVELSPRSAYPFPPGLTAIRGALIEERVAPPAPPQPVQDAPMNSCGSMTTARPGTIRLSDLTPAPKAILQRSCVSHRTRCPA